MDNKTYYFVLKNSGLFNNVWLLNNTTYGKKLKKIQEKRMKKIKNVMGDDEYLDYHQDNNIEYIEYIAENLDKTIQYSEYIAENLYGYETEIERIEREKRELKEIRNKKIKRLI